MDGEWVKDESIDIHPYSIISVSNRTPAELGVPEVAPVGLWQKTQALFGKKFYPLIWVVFEARGGEGGAQSPTP